MLLGRSSYVTTPLPSAVDEDMSRVVDTYRTHVVHCMSQVIDAVDSMLQMVEFQVGKMGECMMFNEWFSCESIRIGLDFNLVMQRISGVLTVSGKAL